VLNSDVMDLVILTAITLVGILVAITAEGKIRIAISWFVTTILLMVNGTILFQYFKSQTAVADEAVYNQRLVDEKNKKAESQALASVGAENSRSQDLKSSEIAKLQELISLGKTLAESLSTINLDDYALSEESRIAQATSISNRTQELKATFNQLKPTLVHYRDNAIAQAFEKLDKSALYSKMYYTSSDSDQEDVREKVMRTSAVAAKELFLAVERKLETMK